MVVRVSGSRGRRKYLGQKCLPRLSLSWMHRARAHTHTHTHQMSSPYARATPQRDQSQARPARHLGSISTRKIPLLRRPLITPRAVTFSLGGSSATTTIIIKVYPSGPARTLTLTSHHCHSASFRIVAERVSTTCFCGLWLAAERRSPDWHLVEGYRRNTPNLAVHIVIDCPFQIESLLLLVGSLPKS
jgi:hypothetical protein